MWNNKGMTLLELMLTITIIAILAAVAVPTIFYNWNREGEVASASRNLLDDLKWAQSEAQKQGNMELSGGQLINRRIFVVFDAPNNTYSVWRWEDEDGDNIPETGELGPTFNNPNNDAAIKTEQLDDGVSFGSSADVDKTACNNASGAPSGAIVNLSAASTFPPCSSLPCIQFDSKGFIRGQSGDIVIYLTNNQYNYAITTNGVAGILRMCKWVAGSWQMSLE